MKVSYFVNVGHFVNICDFVNMGPFCQYIHMQICEHGHIEMWLILVFKTYHYIPYHFRLCMAVAI